MKEMKVTPHPRYSANLIMVLGPLYNCNFPNSLIPLQHQASGDSSSLMTSDPTSDSSDNGGSNKKRNPYLSGDSKCVNNESDDSQSSEPGLSTSPSPAALPSASQGTPMDCDDENQVRLCLLFRSFPCSLYLFIFY